ncbi:MAG: T9SS type A sorting domain-containing protein [Sphingobacteriales bacterium]|nr:MAG: T9SS type A sorting domain-containing protein [Sphingobacteriales bacterium]
MRYFTNLLTIAIAGFCCVSTAPVSAQGVDHPFYTVGKKIVDPCGNDFIPRGVNYSLVDDWDFPGNMNSGELSSEIVKANPNTVRIEWYVNYPSGGRPAYALSDLDSVITRFNRAGIVSMVELHDLTGSDNFTSFNNTLLSWWTSPTVVALLQKHKTHIMLNFANEFGLVDWAANPATAYTDWVNHYKNAITAVRNAGIDVPVVIDGPEYGTNLDRVLQAGSTLVTHDPLNRVIMSVHAYWYQKTAADMNTVAIDIANAGFPIILGEVANVQDANGNCSDAIPAYTDLLQSCQTNSIGWLAWTWTNDNCGPRQVTPDGMYGNLSAYGGVIVNNASFGLASHATKACFAKLNVASINDTKTIRVYPNPTQDAFTIESEADGMLYLYNIQGQVVVTSEVSKGRNEIQIAQLPAGIYSGKFAAKGSGELIAFRMVHE